MSYIFANAAAYERRLTILIVGLVAIAFFLMMLTAWYWRYTDPKKRVPMSARNAAARSPRQPVRKTSSGQQKFSSIRSSVQNERSSEVKSFSTQVRG